MPRQGKSVGARVTSFGDEERMSVRRNYLPAARNSVTGITSCAVKVGLLITCQMDCSDMAVKPEGKA
jgi:hypothetical protein